MRLLWLELKCIVVCLYLFSNPGSILKHSTVWQILLLPAATRVPFNICFSDYIWSIDRFHLMHSTTIPTQFPRLHTLWTIRHCKCVICSQKFVRRSSIDNNYCFSPFIHFNLIVSWVYLKLSLCTAAAPKTSMALLMLLNVLVLVVAFVVRYCIILYICELRVIIGRHDQRPWSC